MNQSEIKRAQDLTSRVSKLFGTGGALSPRPVKVVEKIVYTGKPGAKGDRGERGERGERGPKGADGKDGKDAVVKSAEQIAEELNSLEGVLEAKVLKDIPVFDPKELKAGGKYQLELRDIKGARLDKPNQGFNMNDQRWHGGGSSSSASVGTNYDVSGTIDGMNDTFTIPVAVSGDFTLFLARQPQAPTVDYSYVVGASTTTITYVVPPDASLSSEPHWAFVVG